MTVALKKPRMWTPERFLKHEEALKGYELVNGKLEKKSMSATSAKLNVTAGCVISRFVDDNRLGHVFGSECTYMCCVSVPDQIRKPDCSFIRYGRFADDYVLPDGHVTLVPDLIVEVISKNEKYETTRKIAEFREAGTPLIWVVDSHRRRMQIYRKDGTSDDLREHETISGEDILPGFTAMVSDFLPPRPPAS